VSPCTPRTRPERFAPERGLLCAVMTALQLAETPLT
jgi:hypothetical protein